VLIFVTVEAQQLPVTSVGRIVVVVVVFVMNREFAKLFSAKFASAPGTNPGINFERLRPIGLLPLLTFVPRLGNYPVLPFGI
jgi:hypothetical protein